MDQSISACVYRVMVCVRFLVAFTEVRADWASSSHPAGPTAYAELLKIARRSGLVGAAEMVAVESAYGSFRRQSVAVQEVLKQLLTEVESLGGDSFRLREAAECRRERFPSVLET